MRRLAILVSVIFLCLSPAVMAADATLPICADEEFLEFFDLIVEHQALFVGDIANASMLNRVSREQLDRRDSYPSEAPLCADAIAIQRLLIQLGGDALARAALELADLPADDNPYLRRLPSDQTRIDALLSAMLSIDRSATEPADQRDAPACAPEHLTPLDDAAAALLDAANATNPERDPPETLAAIDQLLLWREEVIPALPACADSIDLIQAMSAAATDSAAYLAFTYAGVSPERNPFPPHLEAAIATVTSWREQFPLIAARHAAASSTRASITTELQACPQAELADALADLQTEYAALLERAEQANSSADLAEYGEAQIAFRESRLAELPLCAEALELRWWAAETLADAALRSAIALGAPASIRAGRGAAMTGNEARASSGWETLGSALANDDSETSAPQGAATAPECTDAEHSFLNVYLTPEFWSLTDAALAITQPEDLPAFIDQSDAFRQLLWTNLPRCHDALEMGLIMRAVAADAGAMFALELAGAPAQDMPYLPKIVGGVNRLVEWADQFNSTCRGADGQTSTYYVVAETIANIRSCASTNCAIATTAQRGQRLNVVDDSNAWHEVLLPNCETAYIAAFLASQTPPAR